jgi:4'-phosphopantetheinyl transferase
MRGHTDGGAAMMADLSPAANMPHEGMRNAAQAIALHADSAVDIATTDLDVAPEVVRALARLLSASEMARASRFIRNRDRDRFIVARGRLRQLLAARLDEQPESVEITYGAHGKPALAPGIGGPSDLRFNVSHCENLAVYAFASGREIGVDVEAVRAIPDADDIAARFFSRRETAAYLALMPRDRPLGFFNCWTRKEAFIKAIGEGLSHPLDRFDVTLTPVEPARILRVADKPGERCGWALHSFSPAPGFVAAVVVRDCASLSASAANPEASWTLA